MGTVGKIVCKTIGVAGISAVLYDAYSIGKSQAKRTSQQYDADYFEKIHSDTRNTSIESPMTSAMQERVASWRTNTPVSSFAGGIRGAVGGFFKSLGDNIIPAATASLALAGKGIWSKLGAWGTVGYGLFIIAREGFGVTKKSPMD